jgi:hypothetical protein
MEPARPASCERKRQSRGNEGRLSQSKGAEGHPVERRATIALLAKLDLEVTTKLSR